MLKNQFSGYGRIVNDLELKTASNDTDYVNFTVAINRGGESDVADFIDCSIFGRKALIFSKHASKGSIILFNGRLQTYMTEHEDRKIKHTNVVISEFQLFSGFEYKKEEQSSDELENYDFGSFEEYLKGM